MLGGFHGYVEPPMACTGMITMSMRELDRLKVIEAVAEARLMPWRAAERLGISRRQVERLLIRYRESGASGLVSRRRGSASNHQLAGGLAQRALALIHERHADFGPTLACEKLAECHGVVLSKETVRKLMTDAGLWIPRPPVMRASNRLPSPRLNCAVNSGGGALRRTSKRPCRANGTSLKAPGG
jgi:transposase